MRRTLPIRSASGRQAACLLLRAVGCPSHGAFASSSAPVWLVLAGHCSQQQEFSLRPMHVDGTGFRVARESAPSFGQCVRFRQGAGTLVKSVRVNPRIPLALWGKAFFPWVYRAGGTGSWRGLLVIRRACLCGNESEAERNNVQRPRFTKKFHFNAWV